MVFTLQTETSASTDAKYSIDKEGQGSPFRLNNLADKGEKTPYDCFVTGISESTGQTAAELVRLEL